MDKIRSKLILNIIFEKLLKKIKLNILKYNKKLIGKLNLGIKDFKEFKYIKNMNNKLGTNITNIEVEKKDLSNKI